MFSHVSSRFTALLCSALFSFVTLSQVQAQSDTSSIAGTVRDSSGSVVPNAAVVLRNEATSTERRITTNESGNYVAPTLAPGFYTITVQANGFKKYVSQNNKLDPSIPLGVDVALEVGAATETVQVEANSETLQTESATLGKLVEGKQVSDLQLNGRNPIFLALLKPGVRGGSLAGFTFGLDSGGFNINGGRGQDNLITFDGAVGVRTRSNGTSVGTADLDSVQEVQVLTANYSAEYGRSSGGQIRIITKSGTSKLHGTGYEYFRNSALNANSWSRNQSVSTNFVAPFRYNQYGFNVNGPVIIPKLFRNRDRNKLFFLFSQEYVRQRNVATSIRTVPTAAMKGGNFGEFLNPASSFFNGVQLKDPLSGAPFAGNIIPASRFSPNGVGLLNVYPNPTPGFLIGRQNWIGSASAPTNQRKDTYSFDINPSEKHTVRVRLQNYTYLDLNPFQSNFDLYARVFDRPNQTGSVNWIWTVTPTLINEALVTASRDKVRIGIDTSNGRFDRTKYGINFPYAFPGTKNIANKIPTVDINDFDGYNGSPYPSSSAGPIYDISDNITKIVRNHTLKFGGLFERSGQNDFDQINVQGVPGGTDNQNGRFQFSNSRIGGGTGAAVSDALLGLFDTYAEIGTRSYTPYRGQMYEWFAQDSWKTTSKLTVTLGIRHSIIRPYYSLWRNQSVFDPRYYDPAKAVKVDPKTGNPIAGSGDPFNGIVIPGDGFTDGAKGRVPVADNGSVANLFHGLDKRYSDTHWTNFQPRLGFAYGLNSKTVLRAGAGRFITRVGVSDSVFLGGNPPFQPIASFATGSVDNPSGGGANTYPISINSQDRVFANPEAYTWNFTAERQVGQNTSLEVSYVGRRGLHGQRERNINQLQPGTLQANPGINANALRPFKGFGPIRVTNNDANSIYNGLQFGLTRRFTKGLSYGVAYTLSKSSDDGSNQRDVIPNAYNAHDLWGPSDYDSRHVIVLNLIYELPIFRDSRTLLGKTLGGWEVTSVTQFQTGTPFKVQTSDDFAGVGSGSGNQIASLWNINGDPHLDNPQFATGGKADPSQYFKIFNSDGSRIFTPPAAGTFTTQRNRNLLYNTGFQNWNIGLFKRFRVTESQALTFRAEGFNFINHPNWSGADNNPNNYTSTFGKVTSKNSERTIQLSLRYAF